MTDKFLNNGSQKRLQSRRKQELRRHNNDTAMHKMAVQYSWTFVWGGGSDCYYSTTVAAIIVQHCKVHVVAIFFFNKGLFISFLSVHLSLSTMPFQSKGNAGATNEQGPTGALSGSFDPRSTGSSCDTSDAMNPFLFIHLYYSSASLRAFT